MAECLTPITLMRRDVLKHRVGKGLSDIVPCGKCPSCLQKRKSHWLFRLKMEQERALTSSFLTLTYDDEHLPFSDKGLMTLNKTHFPAFMKRLRNTIKYHGEGFQINSNVAPIKYYMCGEYGDNTYRPHYHAIVYNLPEEMIYYTELIERDWQMGNVMVAECNEKTIAYTCKYTMKKVGSIKDDNPLDDRQPEYSAMSKKLGDNFLTPQLIQFMKNNLLPYIPVENGKMQQLPRYYRDKIYSESEKKIINKKTLDFVEKNPKFESEKQKVEYIANEFKQLKRKNLLERK